MSVKKKADNLVGALIRDMESDYTSGSVTISDYVQFNMYETLNTIDAYLNSKHISGEIDSLGREKPFFNICIAASNIWFRATDIDRKDIKIKASSFATVIPAFFATHYVQDWMTKSDFGTYLNNWGRTLSRYGSAVTKFVEKNDELSITIVPWLKMIVDPIDFYQNPQIEVLDLTKAELKKRKYNKSDVESLFNALSTRKTLRGNRKDTKSGYIRLYEIHGEMPLSWITGEEKDDKEYVQQMQVVSYVESQKKGEYQDFVVYRGREEKCPYQKDDLISEDGRTLAIGSVEHLFQSQWMVNHSAKAIKDQLDFASKQIFQTADKNFVGRNILTDIEIGDIFVHEFNKPLSVVNNQVTDVNALQSFSSMWKSLGNEIVGVSEAMLGAMPKSGTAWRQTEAVLREGYSLFELMTENKGLALEKMFREHIIPFLKKRKMNNSKEIIATLKKFDIEQIDARYIKSVATQETNRIVKESFLSGVPVYADQQAEIQQAIEGDIRQQLSNMGNARFLKPDEIGKKTWKEVFKDIEWNLEFDITSENKDYQGMLATLNTALQVIMNPAYETNKKAQYVVDKILEATGHISPVELSSIKNEPAQMTPEAVPRQPMAGSMK